MTKNMILTVSLFLIGTLHTLVYAVCEFPSNFLIGANGSFLLYAKLILYSSAITTSFLHHFVCRKFGMKTALILGLFFNLFGMTTLWINHQQGGHHLLLIPNMIFFGCALTSVINSLITFIIVKFPKKTAIGIIVLFAFLNGGLMLGPLLIGFFSRIKMDGAIFPFLILLLIGAILYIYKNLTEPSYPSHLQHLRKGTLIWNELHYRLALFLLANVAYGFTENSFTEWGFVWMQQFITQQAATEMVSFFWLFLIIGQVLLLIPLYCFSFRVIFYPMILFVAASLYFLFHQETIFGFITWIAIGGMSCSIIFPLIISILEKELIHVAEGSFILPFIETAVSSLVGVYILGVGIVDIWQELYENQLVTINFHYFYAMAAIGITGLITLILDITAPKKV